MGESRVSIGQLKRDISELVNRVAYGGERIVLTSPGKPKAALVSMEDYERLRELPAEDRLAHWRQWLADAEALSADILARRAGAGIDVADLLRQDREELEERDGRAIGIDCGH